MIFYILARECSCLFLLPDIGVFIQDHALGLVNAIPKDAFEANSEVGAKLHF